MRRKVKVVPSPRLDANAVTALHRIVDGQDLAVPESLPVISAPTAAPHIQQGKTATAVAAVIDSNGGGPPAPLGAPLPRCVIGVVFQADLHEVAELRGHAVDVEGRVELVTCCRLGVSAASTELYCVEDSDGCTHHLCP